ncbi:Phosphoethanolamine N-methyltransferase 3 [Armadillidium nasatum]|uniref:phosphoethanolamine N-methyltransferase n=1 Tax=Armadillidium nasatum TaxID=96803 RepID=A0A5N5TCA3_9CRUS|nr:Phosphoethanolamine N-methyltransferase 3 [Armadillidium nasatum]
MNYNVGYSREIEEEIREKMKRYWQVYKPSIESMMLSHDAKYLAENEQNELLSYLPPLQRFTSRFALVASHVTAVDFMESYIKENEESNGHFENITFKCADVTKLDFAENSFDLVFSNWLLMYLADSEVEEFNEKYPQMGEALWPFLLQRILLPPVGNGIAAFRQQISNLGEKLGLRSGQRVLHIACGDGSNTSFLSQVEATNWNEAELSTEAYEVVMCFNFLLSKRETFNLINKAQKWLKHSGKLVFIFFELNDESNDISLREEFFSEGELRDHLKTLCYSVQETKSEPELPLKYLKTLEGDLTKAQKEFTEEKVSYYDDIKNIKEKVS